MPLICFSRFVTDLFHHHPSVFLIPRSRRAKLKDFARKPREEAKKRVMSSRVCGKSLIPMFFMSWEVRKYGRPLFSLSELTKATL